MMAKRGDNMLTTIGFDADDTLWQNESFFRLTQDRFADLLADYVEAEQLHTQLLAAERRNLGQYGFGVKGFTLSMIETAIQITEGRVPSLVIAEIMSAGREMLEHPIELLPHARAAVKTLAARFRVVLITKGDLFHQEAKIAQSGLADLFHRIEVVSEKDVATYARVLRELRVEPSGFVMIGNSLRSDIEPVVTLGGWGVHTPYAVTWAHETQHGVADDEPRMVTADTAHDWPAALAAIEAKAAAAA